MSSACPRRSGKPKLEWPTLVLIAACYAGWLAAGVFVYPAHPFGAILLLGFILALQSSLMHEASHGHPTRDRRINEILVGLPIGLVYPFRRFKTLHLRHHADESLTDPFDDPESYYQALWKHEQFPAAMKTVLRINNTMAGRFLIGPLLGTFGFLLAESALMTAGDRAVRRAWLLHALGVAIVIPVVILGFGMPLWLYLLGPVWIGQALISIRTFAEHQWSERPDGRTLIVERSPFSFLFLNNNLHLVHHKSPTVAWYRLPELYRSRREEWVRMNGGYVYANYWSLIREHAFRIKEPVVHPFLRRSPDTGRAFRPRVRARNLNGLGSAPVPAQPPKE